MKRILFSAIFAFAFSANALPESLKPSEVPHFDLEMTGAEWLHHLEKNQTRLKSLDPNSAATALAPVLAFGKRNLDWLKFINSHRATKISLTNPATMNGIPIDKPKEYSDQTTLKAYNDILTELPPEMKKVLVDLDPLTPDHGLVSDDEYIKWGRKIDVIYQTAARWLTMEPWLAHLQMNKQRDVRGHYFFAKEADLENNLRNFSTLPADKKDNYVVWLTANCMNGGNTENGCRSDLNIAISQSKVLEFWNLYRLAAKLNWETFFKIPNGIRFPSLTWDRLTPDLAIVPFTDPTNTDQRDYLWKNIEDEWQWLTWKLKLDFNSAANPKVNVHWQPGITPHVKGLGSGEVYMDSNSPLTEWDVQWTIRHEFGHVVGMPDCYLEFYDPARALIVSYQHDVSDLMCSRKGKFKENHFLEMQRVYFQ